MKTIKISTSLLLVILMSFVFATSYATETRVSSMGGIGLYIRDNSNIFYFPGTVFGYNKQVIGELRTKNVDTDYTLGAHLPLGSSRVFGVYLNVPMDIPTSVINDVVPHLTLNRATALLYGGSLTNYDYGVVLSIASDKWDREILDNKEEESGRILNIAGGISNQQFDLGFNFALPSTTWKLDSLENKWSGYGIGINGRYFTEKMGDMQIVPVGTFFLGSSTQKAENGVEREVDYGSMDISVGVGLNYQYNPENLIVLAIEGFGLSRQTSDIKDGDEQTIKTTTLPGIYLGVESQIKSWLTGRLGASQLYQSVTEESKPSQGESTENTEHNSIFRVSFGLAFNFGNFSLDASFNEGLLFDGPNFLSGINNQISSQISITYKL